MLSDRQAVWASALGCVAVTAGVVLHLPMFLIAREMDYHLAGMPMDSGMLVGMALIVAGVGVAAYGLLPRRAVALPVSGGRVRIAAPEDARLSWAHWWLMLVLVVALVIDVMKPASLGFTIPGMVGEYAIAKAAASLVPFSAVAGTVTGPVLVPSMQTVSLLVMAPAAAALVIVAWFGVETRGRDLRLLETPDR